MSENYVRNVIEAALLAAGRPLPVADLAQLFEEATRPDSDAIRAGLAELAASYEGRGIELKETASGVRIQVRQDYAAEVARLWPERPQRYSRALLETLALIAYRQPITRGEIEQVRGVAVSSNIIQALEEREWIRVVGHRDVPGKPALFGTTKGFLDYFGLKRLDELPPLSELKDIGELEPQLPLDGAPLPVSIASGDAQDEVAQDESTDAVNDGGGTDDEQQDIPASDDAGEDNPSDDAGDDAGHHDEPQPEDDDAADSDKEDRAPSEQKQ